MSIKTTLTRALTFLVAISFLSLLTTTNAAAHDELIDSFPQVQEVLEEVPETVSLTFSGELTVGEGIPNVLLVRDSEETNWAEGDATVNGRTISTKLRPGMPDGEYRVSYRVVYSDGHPDEQMFTFTLATGAETTEEATPVEETPTVETPAEAEQTDEEVTEEEATEEDSGPSVALISTIAVVVILGGALAFGVQRKNRKQ